MRSKRSEAGVNNASAPPCRGPPAPVVAQAARSTCEGDDGCDVEGSSSEENPSLWDGGGVCFLGNRSRPRHLDRQADETAHSGLKSKGER